MVRSDENNFIVSLFPLDSHSTGMSNCFLRLTFYNLRIYVSLLELLVTIPAYRARFWAPKLDCDSHCFVPGCFSEQWAGAVPCQRLWICLAGFRCQMRLSCAENLHVLNWSMIEISGVSQYL